MVEVDVAVVGAGVVGCAVARHLAIDGASVALLDRAADVGDGTSKANTGVLHTGFDTEPGSLESRLVARGHGLLTDYAAAAGIAVERTGALLVAWDDEQEAALPALLAKADANGYASARLLDAAEVRSCEPHLGPGARSGLSVPDEWVIDPWSVTLAFATEAVGAGARLLLATPVEKIVSGDGGHELELPDCVVRAQWLVNAAGLGADRIDALLGHHDFTVTPRRGQLLVFDKLARRLLCRILLPVPTARTKGVLVSPTTWGNVLLGPTAEDLEDRTDTASTTTGGGGTRRRPAGRCRSRLERSGGVVGATGHASAGRIPGASAPGSRPHRLGPGVRHAALPLRAGQSGGGARCVPRGAGGRRPGWGPAADPGHERALPGLLLRGRGRGPGRRRDG